MYQDKVLVCKDCGSEFVFTEGEQEFFAQKGFENVPVRCKECRDKKKERTNQREPRKFYDAVCSDCGVECQVPFEPKDERPVYCSDCLKNHR